MYPSGKHLVMYDLSTKKLDFIKREGDVLDVTCLIAAFTKEVMIVMGENMPN